MKPPQTALPLLFGCQPNDGESLVGFILRLTEANGLRTPNQLLQYISGRLSRPPSVSDIPVLASLCNCDPNRISRLFGFESKDENRLTVWRLGNQALTKPYFISSRTLSFCPACIVSSGFLRAEWEITLNTACPFHGIQLVHYCPHCGRPPRWMRPGVSICTCGGLLTDATPPPANEFHLFISSLIHTANYASFCTINCNSISPDIRLKLAALSLDALCKTLWFLGNVLTLNGNRRAKQEQPTLKKCAGAQKVIDNAHLVLSGWPEKFFDELTRAESKHTIKVSRAVRHDIYDPIHQFLSEDMTNEEFRFVCLAYEHHVKKTWAASRIFHPRSLSPQLDLPLEEA